MSEMQSTPTPENSPKNSGGLAGKLWKERSAKGKAGVVGGAVVALFVIAAAFSDPPAEEEAAPTTTAAAAETTAAPADTTTTAAPTTTEAPQTTTTFTFTAETLRSIFAAALEGNRRDFVNAAEDLFIVESVDFFEYDPSTDLLTLDVTPAYNFEPGVRDDAWELTRGFAAIWDLTVPSDTLDVWEGPNWRVVVATATYECSANVMQRLADARLSRDQWESECRVR